MARGVTRPTAALQVLMVSGLIWDVAEPIDLNSECEFLFPGYHINSDYDAIYDGCYRSHGAIFPMNPKVDVYRPGDLERLEKVENGKDIVQRCGIIALQHGAEFFGVENFTECHYGNVIDAWLGYVTHANGCENYCRWDIGGLYAMVVYRLRPVASKPECPSQHLGYKINSELWAANRGCYHRGTTPSVLPLTTGEDVSQFVDRSVVSRLEHGGMVVSACASLALRRGSAFFGVSNYTRCYFGGRPDYSPGEITKAERCSAHCGYDVGGSGAMMVYEIEYA